VTLNDLATVALLAVVAAAWPFCIIRKASPTAGTAGSQGEGTGGPETPGARRPEGGAS
jgi:hypothetical protein